MEQLTIHIGLPKTGTTSLQTHAFSRLPGYLGKFPSQRHRLSPSLRGVLDAYRIGLEVDNERVFEVGGQEAWASLIEPWVKHLLTSEARKGLLSDEDLAGWRYPVGNAARWPVLDSSSALPRRGPHPVIRFLEQVRARLPLDIELKSVLVLRNQSDWLGSLAAQAAVSNTAFVQRVIRNKDAFLDFHSIVVDLERLLGAQNHKTILFESGLEHIASEIIRFAGYPDSDIPSPETLRPRANVRRQGDNEWVVADEPSRLDEVLVRLRAENTFVERFYQSGAWRRILRPFLGPHVRRRILHPNYRRQTISLTQEQRATIRAHCQKSNARLSEHLGLDLTRLGY